MLIPENPRKADPQKKHPGRGQTPKRHGTRLERSLTLKGKTVLANAKCFFSLGKLGQQPSGNGHFKKKERAGKEEVGIFGTNPNN